MLLLSLIALWMTLAIVFNLEPSIDRAVSAAFFRATSCAGQATACSTFPAAASAFLNGIRNVLHYLPVAATVVVLAVLASEFAAGRSLTDPRPRLAAAALATLLAGPAIIVNGILKSDWGRPRPVSTDLFGGTLPFVPAGDRSDACASNCSFVSGEASSIFWLVCLVPLLPPAIARTGTFAVVAAAIVGSMLRVAFGRHYLSDVVLGGLLTMIVFAGFATLADCAGRRTGGTSGSEGPAAAA